MVRKLEGHISGLCYAHSRVCYAGEWYLQSLCFIFYELWTLLQGELSNQELVQGMRLAFVEAYDNGIFISTEAQKVASVAEIQYKQKIMEKESQQKISLIEGNFIS